MNNCIPGCTSYHGGEIKHHKDCPHYPGSLSEYYDTIEQQQEKGSILIHNNDNTNKMRVTNKEIVCLLLGEMFKELISSKEEPDIVKAITKTAKKIDKLYTKEGSQEGNKKVLRGSVSFHDPNSKH